MNNQWEQYIESRLTEAREKDLFRSLTILEDNASKHIIFKNKRLINFASNNYLGLATDERIINSGYDSIKKWGVGSGASRLISGTSTLCFELEKMLAKWIGKEKTLIFNSGYHANIGLLSSLATKDTVIFCDKLNHASIYDGIKLSPATMFRYRHNDVNHLTNLLKEKKNFQRRIIITDAVFSMEGDIAKLEEIVKVGKKHDALIIVDEAHSMGIFGKNGNGITAQLGLLKDVDIIMATFGKSFGVFGAFVAADQLIIDYLINYCRPFIFTTALPPFILGAVQESLKTIVRKSRGKIVLKKAAILRRMLNSLSIDTGFSDTQIVPVIVKSEKLAIDLMHHLWEGGFYVPAIRPPTVLPNSSRIRLSVAFHHTDEEIDRLCNEIRKWYENKNLL